MDTTLSKLVRAADVGAIEDAAVLLRRGGLVAFPTETVYGLGADATNGEAVASIFAAKGRPQFNPLIVHVRNLAQAMEHAVFSKLAEKFARFFWPGPLTLVLPRRSDSALSLLVSAGLETVALRVPAHSVARALIAAAGVPVAAPSANPSGRITATTAAHVAQGLGDKIDLVLDGGATSLGIESTVIGFEGERPVLLRSGAFTRSMLEKMVGPIGMPEEQTIASPGQLASHYAPRAALRLNAMEARPGEVLLGFGAVAGARLNLSPAGNLKEAAANLFAMLHELDGVRAIAVSPIPEAGLGEAINDRLRRAAAPRDA